MTASGDVVGQVVVNVRVCEESNPPCMDDYPENVWLCAGCQRDGTYNAERVAMVERVDVFIQWGSGYMGTAELEIDLDPDGNYFRPVENGDTDE